MRVLLSEASYQAIITDRQDFGNIRAGDNDGEQLLTATRSTGRFSTYRRQRQGRPTAEDEVASKGKGECGIELHSKCVGVERGQTTILRVKCLPTT